MAIYEFPMASGAALPSEAAVAAELTRLELPAAAVHAEARGDTLRLTGTVADPDVHERVLLAVGNMPGVGRVDDRLAHAREPPLLGTLGDFANLPPGAASADMAEEMVHDAGPERIHADMLGPAGSAFHVVREGETLDDIARLHHGDAIGALRILHANRPMLQRAEDVTPGMVLRVPRRI
jgi:nucleoid-associated protein YgaU